ncbi:DUF5805 domain-containing protein [Haloparvum sp. PAK95]|uniref:DUF5805 domain-containing protein n=1 Tax=Haloparvum sp. PAK95 TaxID=3418962 RepID=UPI003D2EB42D
MSEADDRTAVKTYVPRYQKEIWAEHADELDMSQSEFVRTMVQAGRSDFDVDVSIDEPSEDVDDADTETAESSGDLEGRVTKALRREGSLGWDTLVETLTADLEDDLEAALENLQESNVVRYSGRDGGYVIVDE